MARPNPASVRIEGLSETLRALDKEMGDNGRLYRQTVKAVKAAGNQAVNRARGYLPDEENLPSGFTHKNVRGWAVSRTDRDRAFPRYDRQAATSSIRVTSVRGRSVRTEAGWQAGRMYGIALEMKDPAGSIYDVAGNGKSRRQRAKRSNDPRSRRFIGELKKAWIGDSKWRFRVVLPAVVDTRPDIIRDIKATLAQASAQIPDARNDYWSIR